MPKFVEVYSKATGRKQWVPEHFLRTPALGAGFELVPSVRDKQIPEGLPDDSWTRKQIDAYAAQLDLDTTALPKKQDALDAIAAHQAAAHEQAPGADAPTETPDAGDQAGVDTTQTTDGTESSDETPA